MDTCQNSYLCLIDYLVLTHPVNLKIIRKHTYTKFKHSLSGVATMHDKRYFLFRGRGDIIYIQSLDKQLSVLLSINEFSTKRHTIWLVLFSILLILISQIYEIPMRKSIGVCNALLVILKINLHNDILLPPTIIKVMKYWKPGYNDWCSFLLLVLRHQESAIHRLGGYYNVHDGLNFYHRLIMTTTV